MSIIITLLFVAVIVYLVNWILGMISIPSQIRFILNIVIAIIVVLFLLNLFGIYSFKM